VRLQVQSLQVRSLNLRACLQEPTFGELLAVFRRNPPRPSGPFVRLRRWRAALVERLTRARRRARHARERAAALPAELPAKAKEAVQEVQSSVSSQIASQLESVTQGASSDQSDATGGGVVDESGERGARLRSNTDGATATQHSTLQTEQGSNASGAAAQVAEQQSRPSVASGGARDNGAETDGAECVEEEGSQRQREPVQLRVRSSLHFGRRRRSANAMNAEIRACT
jgi:hypothetical protein